MLSLLRRIAWRSMATSFEVQPIRKFGSRPNRFLNQRFAVCGSVLRASATWCVETMRLRQNFNGLVPIS
jgi:hypothetical protein